MLRSIDSMAGPLISVVVPAYNAVKFIGDCVDSLLEQTYKNIEIIIVDDNSIDGTHDLLIHKYSKYKNITILSLEANSGPGRARNVGISHANGEYIAFLDADDIAVTQRLATQLSRLIDENSDVCVSSLKNFGLGKSHVNKIAKNQEALLKISLLKCPFPQPSVFGKSCVFKDNKYKENIKAEDYELWTRLLSRYKFSIIDTPLVYGRNHLFNMSSSSSELITSQTHAIRVSSLNSYGFELSEFDIDILERSYAGELRLVEELSLISILIRRIAQFGYSDKFTTLTFRDQLYWIFRRNLHLSAGIYTGREFSAYPWFYFGLANELKLGIAMFSFKRK